MKPSKITDSLPKKANATRGLSLDLKNQAQALMAAHGLEKVYVTNTGTFYTHSADAERTAKGKVIEIVKDAQWPYQT